MTTTWRQKEVHASDGVRLAHSLGGQDPAVLLLHGFSQWGLVWHDNGVAARLCDRLTVILPDRRGHGRSGRPTQPGAYGMRLVDDMVRLLDAEGIAAAHLIGFSQGSEVAWRMAMAHPDRVASLMLIASGWPGPDRDLALQGYADILAWLPQAIATGKDWLTPHPDPDSLTAMIAAMPALLDVPEAAWGAVTMPVLGIAGDADPERPSIDRLAGFLPQARLEVFADTDHLDSSRHPQLPGLIDTFLTEVEMGAEPDIP